MSVLSLTPKEGNPVTLNDLQNACASLDVTVKDEEREDYRKLLATFHEAAAELMNMSALKDNISVAHVPSLFGTEFVKDYTPQLIIVLGGSVRIPACNCGLVGLKPTFGLIPYTGCSSNEPTNDHLGTMTRTVLDTALLLSAIAGPDHIDDRSSFAPFSVPSYHTSLLRLSNPIDLSDLRIGVITESLASPTLHAGIRSTFLAACSRLTSISHATVVDVSIPLHTKGPLIWTGVSKPGGYLTKLYGAPGRRTHELLSLNDQTRMPLPQERWDAAYPATKHIYLAGAYAANRFPALQAKATNLSRALRDAYEGAMEREKLDVLITPTLPTLPGPHCRDGAGPIEKMRGQLGVTENTCGFNQTGHPAMTVPMGMVELEEGPLGRTGRKVPVGMQIVGRWFAEEVVLRVGFAWEQGNEWKEL
ncbi:MAG: hypothetical protein Q9165_001106 [Trypethelium subeluteriae]